jgi:hypothetical protein
MIEGLWTVVFSSGSIAGAGVIYMTDGQAVGGDNQYFYKGPYTFDSRTRLLHARLQVTAFVRGAIAVFGVPIASFTLELAGTVTGDSATASGSVLEMPSMKIQIQLVKRAGKVTPTPSQP